LPVAPVTRIVAITLINFLRYCLLVVCALLSLRVLVVVSGEGCERCGQGMKG
jgi:hypothetical protein